MQIISHFDASCDITTVISCYFQESSEAIPDEGANEQTETDQQTQKATVKEPSEANDSADEIPDKTGPLQRKGGFKLSPGTTRRSSW